MAFTKMREKWARIDKRKGFIIILWAVLILAAATSVYILVIRPLNKEPPPLVIKTVPINTPEPEPTYPSIEVENPIDFDSYWAMNPDVYAYIYIENTNVDYPILQHANDNAYYLDYNIDGTKGYPGCIYTEIENKKDFLDFNTVIYGHNMKNGTMFRTLHKYKDADFFWGNRYIYIYTPDRILQYKTFSAYTYSDDRIVYWYDFSKPEECQRYLDMVKETAPKKGIMDESIPLTTDDKMITLLTCTGSDTTRWLVQGVLINDFPCEYGTRQSVSIYNGEEVDMTGAKRFAE